MIDSKHSSHGAVISRPIVTATALLVLLLATGCSSRFFAPPPDDYRPLGNATSQNIAAHIVNPNPPDRQAPPNLDGRRAAVAIGRYQRNRVIRPEDPGVVGDNN